MFNDRLTITLTLTIGGQTYNVPAGNLKSFELELWPWGFQGRAEWWTICRAEQSEDTLFTSFMGQQLTGIQMVISRAFVQVTETADDQGQTLTVKGLVMDKGVFERSFPDVQDSPVLHRRYTIRFADRGFVLWRQHFPSSLYVDKTIKDLIADNLPDGVTVDHNWAAATVQHPVLSLGLGAATNDASFYDFLFWLLDRQYAGLYYDIAKDAYSICDSKPTGTPFKLLPALVSSVETVFPEVRREAWAVLNSYTDAALSKKDIPNPNGVTGVRTDFMIRSPIASDLTDRVSLETTRACQPNPEVNIELASFPATPLLPSMALTLDSTWSNNVYQFGKTYRVYTATLKAKAVDQEATANVDDKSARYELDYALRLELGSDTYQRYPKYAVPVWPFYVEGKVLSEVGTPTELTFQPYTDAQTSIDYHKVKIPLWGDIKVIVAFEPTFFSGHFFFPLYKDQRVLIALEFDSARIRSFLDWRPGGRLPTDSQGNHILVGKEDAKNQTSIRHVYVDAKPQFIIERIMGSDHQLIKIDEGGIHMVTRNQ
jgi:hypothetical protein